MDRNLRHKPFLAFESGLTSLIIEKQTAQTLPGLDGAWVENELEGLVPQDAHFFHLPRPTTGTELGFGCLRNYGSGPAMSVNVYWAATGAWLRSATSPERERLRQKMYQREFCIMPSVPHHISPDESAKMPRLPSFILADYVSEIATVEGILEIEYRDIFGKSHKTKQIFRMFLTELDSRSIRLDVTFADLVFSGKSQIFPVLASIDAPTS